MVAKTLATGLGFGRITGEGMFKPITQWPPFYPIVLSLFPLLHIDLQVGARWIGCLFGGLNIFLGGLLLYRLTNSYWASLLGSGIILLSPTMAETNIYAMSEPLYITFSLLALIFLDLFLKGSQKNIRWAIPLGLAMALAFLTRYVGFALLLTCIVSILFTPSWSWQKRFQWIFIISGIALIPIGIWMARNFLVAGTMTNRYFSLHPIPSSNFALMTKLISTWRPTGKRFIFVEISRILLSTAIIIIYLARTKYMTVRVSFSSRLPKLALIIGFYFIIYAFAILVSRLFFDQLIPIYEARILSPIYLSGLFLFIFGLNYFWKLLSSRSLLLGSALIVIYVFLVMATYENYYSLTSKLLSDNYLYGNGYADSSFVPVQFITHMDALPQNYVVFTDNIEKLYYLDQQRSSNAFYDLKNPPVNDIRTDINQFNGVIIAYFNYSSNTIAAIQSLLPEMKPYYTGPDGLIMVATK